MPRGGGLLSGLMNAHEIRGGAQHRGVPLLALVLDDHRVAWSHRRRHAQWDLPWGSRGILRAGLGPHHRPFGLHRGVRPGCAEVLRVWGGAMVPRNSVLSWADWMDCSEGCTCAALDLAPRARERRPAPPVARWSHLGHGPAPPFRFFIPPACPSDKVSGRGSVSASENHPRLP